MRLEDDLILDVESDLSLYSFVDAMRLLDKWKFENNPKDKIINYHNYLEINLSNYHIAKLLSAADGGLYIEINNDLEKDEWILGCKCFENKKVNEFEEKVLGWESIKQIVKRVHSYGA